MIAISVLSNNPTEGQGCNISCDGELIASQDGRAHLILTGLGSLLPEHRPRPKKLVGPEPSRAGRGGQARVISLWLFLAKPQLLCLAREQQDAVQSRVLTSALRAAFLPSS